MPDLYIIGAGGLGRGLVDALLYDKKEHIEENFHDIYFVDDNNVNNKVNGILVKYSVNHFYKINEECLVVNAIGSPQLRKKIQEKLNNRKNFSFPNYIDSDVKIYSHVNLGEGNIITRGVVLSTNINIGNFNIIHFNCTVGHDVSMGDYNCIYPLTSLSGYTTLGDSNMIGAGSTTLPNVVLEDSVDVGANSLLRGTYTSKITVVGSPAERLK